jgi:hypothetical protein
MQKYSQSQLQSQTQSQSQSSQAKSTREWAAFSSEPVDYQSIDHRYNAPKKKHHQHQHSTHMTTADEQGHNQVYFRDRNPNNDKKKKKKVKIQPFFRGAADITPMESKALLRYCSVTADSDSDSDSDSEGEEENKSSNGSATLATDVDASAGEGEGEGEGSLFLSMEELDALLLPEWNFSLPAQEHPPHVGINNSGSSSSNSDVTSSSKAISVAKYQRKAQGELGLDLDIDEIIARRDARGEDGLTSFELDALKSFEKDVKSGAHPEYEGVVFETDIENLLNQREKYGEDILTSSELAALDFYSVDIEEYFEKVNLSSSEDVRKNWSDGKISDSIHCLLQKASTCDVFQEETTSGQSNWDIMSKYQDSFTTNDDSLEPMDRAKHLLAMMQHTEKSTTQEKSDVDDQSNWDIMSKYQDSFTTNDDSLEPMDRAKHLLAMMQHTEKSTTQEKSDVDDQSNWDIMSKYQDSFTTNDDSLEPMDRAKHLLAMKQNTEKSTTQEKSYVDDQSNWDIMSKYQDPFTTNDDLLEPLDRAKHLLAMMQDGETASTSFDMDSYASINDDIMSKYKNITSGDDDLVGVRDRAVHMMAMMQSTEMSGCQETTTDQPGDDLMEPRDRAMHLLAMMQNSPVESRDVADEQSFTVDASKDLCSKSSFSPPLPDLATKLALESIHVRISAEMAMNNLEMKLTVTDEDREQEETANKLMEQIEYEREMEVQEILQRLHQEQMDAGLLTSESDTLPSPTASPPEMDQLSSSVLSPAIQEMIDSLNAEAEQLNASTLKKLRAEEKEEGEKCFAVEKMQSKIDADAIMQRLDQERERALQELQKRLDATETIYPSFGGSVALTATGDDEGGHSDNVVTVLVERVGETMETSEVSVCGGYSDTDVKVETDETFSSSTFLNAAVLTSTQESFEVICELETNVGNSSPLNKRFSSVVGENSSDDDSTSSGDCISDDAASQQGEMSPMDSLKPRFSSVMGEDSSDDSDSDNDSNGIDDICTEKCVVDSNPASQRFSSVLANDSSEESSSDADETVDKSKPAGVIAARFSSIVGVDSSSESDDGSNGNCESNDCDDGDRAHHGNTGNHIHTSAQRFSSVVGGGSSDDSSDSDNSNCESDSDSESEGEIEGEGRRRKAALPPASPPSDPRRAGAPPPRLHTMMSGL